MSIKQMIAVSCDAPGCERTFYGELGSRWSEALGDAVMCGWQHKVNVYLAGSSEQRCPDHLVGKP